MGGYEVKHLIVILAILAAPVVAQVTVSTVDPMTAEERADIKAKDDERSAKEKSDRAALRAIHTNLVAVIDGLQTNVDQSVFSGAQRTEFNDLRRLCVDLAREVQALRRALARVDDEP